VRFAEPDGAVEPRPFYTHRRAARHGRPVEATGTEGRRAGRKPAAPRP
jgi:hypothetical protein